MARDRSSTSTGLPAKSTLLLSAHGQIAPDFIAACALFKSVRDVFDTLNANGLGLDTLSMGMSHDLEAAIHAGSTLVRVGTAVFGGRPAAE